MKKRELHLIMPVYNEEEIIEKVISDWVFMLDEMNINYRFFAINDGSQDSTAAILNSCSEKYPHFEAVHKENSGHGPSLLWAYQKFNQAEWIFQLDSDDEIRAKYFPRLWNARAGQDMVLGKRTSYGVSNLRRFISRCAKYTVALFFGPGVSDPNVPFRLFRPERFENVIRLIPSTTFLANVFFSATATRLGFQIKEVGVDYFFRTTGKSMFLSWKILKIAAKAFRDLVLFRFVINWSNIPVTDSGEQQHGQKMAS